MFSGKYLGASLLFILMLDAVEGEPLSLSKQLGEAPPFYAISGRSPTNRHRRSDDECKRVCTPVCGTNGMTYCNECHAGCLGIPLHDLTQGCETWRHLQSDECANCRSDYEPVCACGRVYYNSCVANCMDIWNYMYTDGLC